jgi:hypothetical protein
MCTFWVIVFFFWIFILTRRRGHRDPEGSPPPQDEHLRNTATGRFSTMFTTAHHWSLSWARRIQSTLSQPISQRSILIFSSHLRVCFLYTFLIFPTRTTWPTHLVLLDFSSVKNWGSRDISVSIVTRLRAGRPSFDSRKEQRFLLFAAYRPALGPTQPHIQWVPVALFLWIKRPGREADHSPSSSAEVENAWSYTSTHPYVFMVWCLVKHGDNFTYSIWWGVKVTKLLLCYLLQPFYRKAIRLCWSLSSEYEFWYLGWTAGFWFLIEALNCFSAPRY